MALKRIPIDSIEARRRRLLCVLCVLCGESLSACGGVGLAGEACDLQPGELVITELMIHPLAPSPDAEGDAAGEWIEIYNATSARVALDRLHLVRRAVRPDGSEAVSDHEVRGAGDAAVGAYLVLAAGAPGGVPVDYSYGADNPLALGDGLGELPNLTTDTYQQVVVELRCRSRLIDQVAYATPPAVGSSLRLDGAALPEARYNDATDSWCSGGDPYDDAGNLGSPGIANLACATRRCDEAGVFRDARPSAVGDVLISEVLLDPRGGADTHAYWIELYGAGRAPVEPNGVQVLSEGGGAPVDVATIVPALSPTACITLEPGRFIVVGESADRSINGGLEVGAAAPGLTFSTPFKDAGGRVTLRDLDAAGSVVDLDVAALPARHGAASGRSLGLDGPALALSEALRLNDRAAAYCYAPAELEATGFGLGTPGGPNPGCGTVACLDDGVARAVVPAAPGQLVLTEVYADPSGNDAGKEWLEVQVAAGPVDVNGLEVWTQGPDAIAVHRATARHQACVSAESGAYVVVGIGVATELGGEPQAGGVTPDIVAVTELGATSLPNVDHGEWLQLELRAGDVRVDTATIPGAGSGASVMLDAAHLSSTDNDEPRHWCVPEVRGFFEGAGTPGLANVCGPWCRDGGVPRGLRPPAAGDLVLTEIAADPPNADAGRDWLELFVVGTGPYDLNGLAVWNSNGVSENDWTLGGVDCLSLAGGAFAILAGPGAGVDGVLATATFGGPTDTLLYGAASSQLRVELRLGPVTIDAAAPYTPVQGSSFALDAAALSPAGTPHLANDEMSAWCQALAPRAGLTYPGSPGVANELCR